MADLESKPDNFRVLCLDGGGAKGIYTLGVLLETERLLQRKLHECFDLIYGTSTGAIIASALAIGHSVDDIISQYKVGIPKIMRTPFVWKRAKSLRALLNNLFGDRKFDAPLTGLCVVASNSTDELPLIFKSKKALAHGLRATFDPGFGCTIAEAVEASCAAYPFLPVKAVSTSNQGVKEVIDGGFVANNPALYALIDATQALGVERERIRFLSIGTGSYPIQYPITAKLSAFRHVASRDLIEKQFNLNARSVEKVFQLLAKGVESVRINDTFNRPEHGTSLFESNPRKLDLLQSLGRQSFAQVEGQISALLR